LNADKNVPVDVRSLLRSLRTDGVRVVQVQGARRRRLTAELTESLLDDFEGRGARCLFWRARGRTQTSLRLRGGYRMTTAQAGGWLLLAIEDGQPSYWLPVPPTQRRIDDQGRVFEEGGCPISSFQVGDECVEVGLSPTAGNVIDLVIWEIDPQACELAVELERLEAVEQVPTFLWGSHGIFRVPSDLYRNLVQGSILDLRFAWPHKRRAFSENEAHALHLTLRNRGLATGKGLYRHLRDQVLLSVLSRQEADGAFRQGIWTADLECHFRLHCSAMHMLMDCYSERPDPAVLASLKRAATFVSGQAAEVMGETWFLHDSLEQSEERIGPSMPAWYPCTNPSKAPSNTLVLNTHIDTLVALRRFGSIADSAPFADRISSARRLLKQLMAARPAGWRYRMLLRPLYLTLLPAERARALPLPKRALKRFARERFIPWLTRLKCRAPRFAMPEGYVDRALGIRGFADAYHSINFMDLVRYRREFPEDSEIDEAIDGAMEFTSRYDLRGHWSEHAGKAYAIGFWVEGLYQLYLLRGGFDLCRSLAQSAIFAERKGLGLSPSLAGNNLELMPLRSQQPCPAPPDGRLRVVNLSRNGGREYMVINPCAEDVKLERWEPFWAGFEWMGANGRPATEVSLPVGIKAGDWILLRKPASRRDPKPAGP
jgi:hypothetical protein